MAAIKLITAQDFTADTVNLPGSLKDAVNVVRIDRCILDAQQVDLKPLLGYALYNELLQNNTNGITYTAYNAGATYTGGTVVYVSQGGSIYKFISVADQMGVTPGTNTAVWTLVMTVANFTKWNNLLNGCTYTDPLGYSVIVDGIKMALIYWTLSRLVMRNQTTITSHSVVNKTSQYSEPVSSKVLALEADGYANTAGSYWQDVKKYLDDNSSTFTNWNATPREKSMGAVKFYSVAPGQNQNDCNDYNK